MEFQKYSRMQEDKLEDLLNELSSFEEGDQKEAEVDEHGDEEERFERSFSESLIPIESENGRSEYGYDQEGFESDRSVYEEQNKSSIQEEASTLPATLKSPVVKHQHSRIPRPLLPQRVLMPEDVKEKGFLPIPGHVFSQARVAPESKVKIFQEKLPDYNKVARSTGYGKTTKRPPPLYVRKPQVVLPPLQQNTQYRSLQLSYLNEGSRHEDFIQYDESLAVKRSTIRGIVKPNLIRKDLMKLRDPTVRPRPAKQITQEVVFRGSVGCQQELKLPKIPQPPSPRSNNNKINSFAGSRIPKLPTIQHHQGISGIPKPPQPPIRSRSRPGASHRRYVDRNTGLPFPRRQ